MAGSRTGDIGIIDKDGFYYYRRRKELSNASGGKKYIAVAD